MAPRINIPPITRGLILTLIVCSVLDGIARYRAWTLDSSSLNYSSRRYYAPYLQLVPGVSFVYPWVFLSATFAEQNVFGLLITGSVLFYGGRYLERAWSSREYIRFILLIALIPNTVTFFIYILVFIITQNAEAATTAICGGIAIQAAFLVAFKQLVPEHTVTIARGLISMRVKHFPAIFLFANTISGLVFGTDTAMILSWIGFFTAWVYLRFFRMSPSVAVSATGETSSIRGDASDTFAFAYFFPDAIQPPISMVADPLYKTLTAVRVLPAFTAEDVDAGNEQAMARGHGGLPTSLASRSGDGRSGRPAGRREEAERRRALALRALDQRLQSSTKTSSSSGRLTPTPESGAPSAARAHSQPPASKADEQESKQSAGGGGEEKDANNRASQE